MRNVKDPAKASTFLRIHAYLNIYIVRMYDLTYSCSSFQQMRDASEKRKELEQLRSETLKQLREKQLAVKNETNFAEKAKMLEAIEALQSKIRELEKKTELQNVRHEELMIEMAAMKKTQGTNTNFINYELKRNFLDLTYYIMV